MWRDKLDKRMDRLNSPFGLREARDRLRENRSDIIPKLPDLTKPVSSTSPEDRGSDANFSPVPIGVAIAVVVFIAATMIALALLFILALAKSGMPL